MTGILASGIGSGGVVLRYCATQPFTFELPDSVYALAKILMPFSKACIASAESSVFFCDGTFSINFLLIYIE